MGGCKRGGTRRHDRPCQIHLAIFAVCRCPTDCPITGQIDAKSLPKNGFKHDSNLVHCAGSRPKVACGDVIGMGEILSADNYAECLLKEYIYPSANRYLSRLTEEPRRQYLAKNA